MEEEGHGGAGNKAMEIAGLLVQDDLALMIEGNDGRYYFQAGSICVPGFWRMQDKLGMPLDDIHLSGNVPQYKERLQPSLDRFFRKLSVDKPVTRINYFVQTRRRDGEHEATTGDDEMDPDELGWATSSLGDEDDFENGTHATAKPKNGVDRDTPVNWMRLRCERQTLRRLPVSGAVLFTIRVYINPMVELVQEKGVPGRMASALRSWPMDVAAYKGKNRGGWWEPLLRFLDAEHEAQEMEGSEGVGTMRDGSKM
ncbi:hypothetical protein CPB83DRAFT_843426 [Crepidotus variabilis]|uniref:Uncharacterized protein n=1 Tax=Crepidotus variabilis TaxID=179855 RepID=A0A9P6ETU2_9AGAR|nr:hypothetical protein CPB83DRAFT_843426 [Crepidotus variabilis]